jgi:hypothetical protein
MARVASLSRSYVSRLLDFAGQVARVKRTTEQQVQIVHREGELGVGFYGGVIPIRSLHPSSDAPKADCQGGLGVRIAQRFEQAADLIRALVGCANDAQRSNALDPASLQAFEEQAFEFAAVLRALAVDHAATAVEGGARLAHPDCFAGDSLLQGQAECLKPGRVILRLQSQISEDNPVAAQPAGEADTFCRQVARMLRGVQSAAKYDES